MKRHDGWVVVANVFVLIFLMDEAFVYVEVTINNIEYSMYGVPR